MSALRENNALAREIGIGDGLFDCLHGRRDGRLSQKHKPTSRHNDHQNDTDYCKAHVSPRSLAKTPHGVLPFVDQSITPN